MNCEKLREDLLELANGGRHPEAEAHVRECAACAAEVESWKQTMALLDEWQAPEPSPYFDVRLQARLREEKARAQAPGWLAWLRKPAAAVAFTGLIAAGVALMQMQPRVPVQPDPLVHTHPVPPSLEGTAVGDLEALDENVDLLASFELLDDVPSQDAPVENF